MSWSIFGRLFWKVWREDWKRWASVLAVGVVAFGLINSIPINKDPKELHISISPGVYGFLFVIAVIQTASARGQRDSVDLTVTTSGFKIPSAILITFWSSVAALILSSGMSLVVEPDYLKAWAFPFIAFLVVATGLASYSIGIWTHPWLSAVVLLPVFVISIQNYTQLILDQNSQMPYPAFTPSNIGIATIMIVVTSHALSWKWHKRMPSTYQFMLAIAAMSTLIAPSQDQEDISKYTKHSKTLTLDRSMEVSQSSSCVLQLKDHRTGHSYWTDVRRRTVCDVATPMGICRGKYVVALTYDKSKHSNNVICWNYLNNQIKEVVSFANNRYYYDSFDDIGAFVDKSPLNIMTNDGKYMIIRLKTGAGKGIDYWVVNIPARTLKMITANATSGYKIQVIGLDTAVFIDESQNTTQVLKISTANLGPVVSWTGGLKR